MSSASTAGRCAAGLAVLAVGVLSAAPARAYEFAVSATAAGQGYQVRWLRPGEGDRFLNRRRFTQTLRLEVWDILAAPIDPAFPDRPAEAPFDLRFTSSLRIDNDFGEYQTGTIYYDAGGVLANEPALDVVPELRAGALALDVPYAYLEGRGLWNAVDFRLGRQLEIDALDWYAFDGLRVTWRVPRARLAITAHGGLVVRAASLWGTPTFEPDGTSSADCRRVEVGGATWIASDDCPQRDALMPGYGLAVASEGLRHVALRAWYRIARSPTSDAFPTSAPGWGVNQELVAADASARLFGGLVTIGGAGRYNLVLGEVDQADAALRVSRARASLTGEVAYAAPSFDADSIFNVFASEPMTDYRLRGELAVAPGLRTFAAGGARRYHADEGDASSVALAAGARLWSPRGRARLELSHESGEGGLRAGGDLSASTRLGADWALEGRVSVIRFDDPLEDARTTSLGAQAGARVELRPGIALHVLGEANHNRFGDVLRLVAVLDLAFLPEL